MLPFRVILKPQRRSAASPRPASSLRNLCSLRDSALDSSYLLSFNSVASSRSYSTTSIQPLSFQTFTHSPAQRQSCISISFNRFRTLCQKHPGWGYLRSPRSTLSEATTTLRTSHQSPLWPSVPLQPNVLGATIGIAKRNLQDPGKQLRSPRCLRLESGHREPFDDVPGRRPRCGWGCKSCLGPAFYIWTDQQGGPQSSSGSERPAVSDWASALSWGRDE